MSQKSELFKSWHRKRQEHRVLEVISTIKQHRTLFTTDITLHCVCVAWSGSSDLLLGASASPVSSKGALLLSVSSGCPVASASTVELVSGTDVASGCESLSCVWPSSLIASSTSSTVLSSAASYSADGSAMSLGCVQTSSAIVSSAGTVKVSAAASSSAGTVGLAGLSTSSCWLSEALLSVGLTCSLSSSSRLVSSSRAYKQSGVGKD